VWDFLNNGWLGPSQPQGMAFTMVEIDISVCVIADDHLRQRSGCMDISRRFTRWNGKVVEHMSSCWI